LGPAGSCARRAFLPPSGRASSAFTPGFHASKLDATALDATAMPAHHHSIHELFDQLGLPSAPAEIDAFIARHRPDALGCSLHEAPVWTESQASFLREAIADDDDWALPAEWLSNALCR
jgi:hypothetical protein